MSRPAVRLTCSTGGIGQALTAALLLEVDPIELVRGATGRGANGHGSNGHGSNNHADAITHYVNDRPYAASSLLAVALKDVFGTALTGRCDARPDLAATPLPLEIHVPALRCGDGPQLAERVFGPLGLDGRRGVPDRGRR